MSGPVRIAIIANGKQARGEIGKTAESLGLIERAGSKLGKTLAGAFAVTEVVRATKALVETGGQYVETLNKIGAITGSNAAQTTAAARALEANKSAYAQLGQTVGDASDGVLELTKAGLSLKASLKAVYPTMVLAKSGGLAVGDAATLVSNTLNTFSLKASQASQVANDLANAADASSADVADLAESFKYVSPLAAASGVSLAQTNAVLAELANSGLKASIAGTSFRKVLSDLQAPSKKAQDTLDALGVSVYDSQGKFKPFGQILDDLHGKLGKLTEQERKQDLRNLFGLQGIVGAGILIKGGSKELDQYTTSVERAGGASRLATASSMGLVGTLRTVKADFVSTADSIYRQYSPAVDAALKSVIATAGQDLPKALDFAEQAGKRLEPALESLAKLATDVGHDFSGSGGHIGGEFLSALSAVNAVVTTAADALDKLPSPVRRLGVEAAVAAVVLLKLRAAALGASESFSASNIGQFTNNLRSAETGASRAAVAMQGLRSAAGTAAGIGGLLALSDAAGRSQGALKDVETVGGGLATGFAVGGPIGAAIGGTAATFSVLSQASADLTKAIAGTNAVLAGGSRTDLVDYREHLQRLYDTQKVGENSFGLFAKGILTGGYELSVYDGQTKGLSSSIAEINAELGRNSPGAAAAQYQFFGKALGYTKKQFDDLITAADRANRALTGRSDLRDYKAALDDFTAGLKENGKSLNINTAAGRLNQANLDNIAQSALGVARTLKDATKGQFLENARRGFIQAAEEAGKTKKAADELATRLGLVAAPRQAKVTADTSDADRKVKGITSKLTDYRAGRWQAEITANAQEASNKVDATLRSLYQVNTTVATAKVHVDTGSGTTALAFIQRRIDALHGKTVDIYVATHNAQSKGPAGGSTSAAAGVTPKSLVDLSPRLVTGAQHAVSAAQKLLEDLIKGYDRGGEGIGRVIDRVNDYIGKSLDKQLKATEASLRKHLKGAAEDKAIKAAEHANALAHHEAAQAVHEQEKALRALGVAEDKVANQLSNAKSKLADAKQAYKDYAAGIRDAVVATGDVTTLGQGTDADGNPIAATSTSIVADLQAKVAAARQYAELIRILTSEGLNKTTLNQLLQAGVDGGLATAQALVNGGLSTVQQVNQLTAQLTATGSQLGTNAADTLKTGAIKAAEALVASLEKKQKRLDAIAQQMAEALVAAAQAALGGKGGKHPAGSQSRSTVPVSRISAADVYVSRSSTGATADPLVAEVRALRADIAALQAGNGRVVVAAAERFAQTLDRKAGIAQRRR